MSTTPITLGRAANHLLTRHPQADQKAPLKENVAKPITQAPALTLIADLHTHKKDRVCQPKELGKAKVKASSMAKERPEARHLVLLPGTLFEANHPQETPELPLAENGDPQDIVLRIRRPALATTTIHHNAETGQVQAVDVPWGNTVRLFTPLSTASNNTL